MRNRKAVLAAPQSEQPAAVRRKFAGGVYYNNHGVVVDFGRPN
jgi:hypothetical protein